MVQFAIAEPGAGVCRVSTQLMVSVVGRVIGIASLKYMQDISASFCAATVVGQEAQLEDKRDGNKYWVGKMKDDRCWMLQNLALGSTSSATTLTSVDSNVSSDWSLPASRTAASGSATATAVQSWNFGKLVLATPLLTAVCGDVTSLAKCTQVGFVDVSDETNFQPTYTATTGTWNGATVTSNTLIAVNCTSWSGSGTSKKCVAGTYDAHYLVGNYYSWNAAVANRSGSICPKGWRIAGGTATGSLMELLGKYGVDSSLSGTGTDGKTYDIAGAPLRFVRGGQVNPSISVLSGAGRSGFLWTGSFISSNDNSYRVYFNNSSVTSGSSYRYGGHPVRCFAQ